MSSVLHLCKLKQTDFDICVYVQLTHKIKVYQPVATDLVEKKKYFLPQAINARQRIDYDKRMENKRKRMISSLCNT